MRKVLVLGAGASSGTLRNRAPLSRHFGEYLDEKVSDWTTQYPYLRGAIRFFKERLPDIGEKEWALDKVWGAIDDRVKLRYVFDLDLHIPGAPSPRPNNLRIYRRGVDDFGLAGFELKRAIVRVYGHDLESESRKVLDRNGTLASEIERLENGDCVISFNYDLLAEKIMKKKFGDKGRKIVKAIPGETVGEGVMLCKPHGSLSWRVRVPENYVEPKIEPFDEPIEEAQVDYWPSLEAEIQPGIVAPVPFKEQIAIPEIQGRVRKFFCLLVEQWRQAIIKISGAEEITVAGYGFPMEDSHAVHMFCEAKARMRTKPTIRLYQKKECSDRVRKTIQKIFRDSNVIECGEINP